MPDYLLTRAILTWRARLFELIIRDETVMVSHGYAKKKRRGFEVEIIIPVYVKYGLRLSTYFRRLPTGQSGILDSPLIGG